MTLRESLHAAATPIFLIAMGLVGVVLLPVLLPLGLLCAAWIGLRKLRQWHRESFAREVDRYRAERGPW